MKTNIFMYWDNPPGHQNPPVYIQLCLETIRRHCGQDFDINLVTTANVREFLPNIPESFFCISQINNKSNFLRYMLLREYGGIWLDSDLVLFKSLKPLLELLTDDIDMVATASPTLSYGQPECGFLLSSPNGTVITKAVEIIEHALSIRPPGHVFEWGSLGPKTIREAVKDNRYFHLESRLLMPIPSWEAFRFDGIETIDKYCDDSTFGFMLFHQMFKQANSSTLTMGRQQILDSKTLLGQIFRKAMES